MLRRFTRMEDLRLTVLIDRGWDWKRIAARLKRGKPSVYQRAVLLGLHTVRPQPRLLRMKTRLLYLLASDLSRDAVCERLGVTAPTFYRWLAELKVHYLKRDRPWSDEETATLLEFIPKESALYIGRRINRSKNSVIGKAHRLGLSWSKPPELARAA